MNQTNWKEVKAGYAAGLVNLAVKVIQKETGVSYGAALAVVAEKQPDLVKNYQDTMRKRGNNGN